MQTAKHDCSATYCFLHLFINRKKKGTKEEGSEEKEEMRTEQGIFPLLQSPHVSDSLVDDLW